MISDEVAKKAPNNPVWKHTEEDFYIFNNGSGEEWRIGTKDCLTTGSYCFKSKVNQGYQMKIQNLTFAFVRTYMIRGYSITTWKRRGG